MLVGNEKNQLLLDNLLDMGTLVHAYLFTGAKNIGKTTYAIEFARKILCEKCGELDCNCPHCRLVSVGNHPDFLLSDSEEPLLIEEARQMIKFVELKPYQSKHKVMVISHIERMTTSAANALLKTLEEPSLDTVIILTCENPKNILPTIVSRSQEIKFQPVTFEQISTALTNKEVQGVAPVSELIKISGGRVGLAISLSENPEMFERTSAFIGDFEEKVYSNSLVEKLKFAESLAKEKENLALYFDCLESYYRQKLHEGTSNSLMNLKILDKLSEIRDLISRNINLQLAIESLMLVGEK